MYNFNELSSRIDSYDLRARYDAACKRLLANRQILARILKACVSEFYDCDVGDIEEKYIEGTPEISVIPVHQDAEFIEGMNTEDASELEGIVYFDIRMTSDLDEEAMDMCNLSEGVFNRGFNSGFNDGFNDGTDSAVVSVLTSMRQKTDKSIEECLYLMGIPEEKYETYTRMIEEKMGLQPV